MIPSEEDWGKIGLDLIRATNDFRRIVNLPPHPEPSTPLGIPSIEILDDYESFIPGFKQALIQSAYVEMRHRLKMEAMKNKSIFQILREIIKGKE